MFKTCVHSDRISTLSCDNRCTCRYFLLLLKIVAITLKLRSIVVFIAAAAAAAVVVVVVVVVVVAVAVVFFIHLRLPRITGSRSARQCGVLTSTARRTKQSQ